MPNSTRFAGLIGIALICSTLAVLPGCGRKFFPKPSAEPAEPQVGDLQAQVTSRGVELSWSVPPAAAQGQYRFSVTRTEMSWENRNCPECPGLTQPATIPVDQGLVTEALAAPDHRLRWFDANTGQHRAFRYQVSVFDQDKQINVSNSAVAKVFPAPAAPLNVAAAIQPQGVLVRWKPVSKDMHGHNLPGELTFRVERMQGGKPWEKVSPNYVRANSFLDQRIAAEQSYSYRVVPVALVENTPIFGEPSQVVLVKAPESVPPPPPKSVWVIPVKGALEVRWTESDGSNGGYHVYRREGKEIIRLTASPVSHPPFVDSNVKSNGAYSYAVSAVGVQANSKEGLLSKWADMRAVLIE